MKRRVPENQSHLVRVLVQKRFHVAIEHATRLACRIEEFDQHHLRIGGTKALRVVPFKRRRWARRGLAHFDFALIVIQRRRDHEHQNQQSPTEQCNVLRLQWDELLFKAMSNVDTIENTIKDSIGIEKNPNSSN